MSIVARTIVALSEATTSVTLHVFEAPRTSQRPKASCATLRASSRWNVAKTASKIRTGSDCYRCNRGGVQDLLHVYRIKARNRIAWTVVQLKLLSSDHALRTCHHRAYHLKGDISIPATIVRRHPRTVYKNST